MIQQYNEDALAVNVVSAFFMTAITELKIEVVKY